MFFFYSSKNGSRPELPSVRNYVRFHIPLPAKIMLVSNFSMVSLKFNEHVNQHSRKDFINLSRRPYYLIRVLLQNTDLMSIFTIFYLIVGEVGRNYNTYIRRLLLAVL